MATMTATAGRSATYNFRAAQPARSIHWTAPSARASNPIPSTHLVQGADAAMRFGMALVPFSILAWMFIAF
jgi:hypothetical protein